MLMVLSVSVVTFCSLIMTGPDQYVFVFKISKAVLGLSVVQTFTDLYFIQHKKLANIHLISAVAFYLFLICYVQVVGYDQVFPRYNLISSVADQREFHYNLPVYINFFVYFFFIVFNLFALYYIYNILFKFNYNNIYFKRIKAWTFSFFMIIVGQLILILITIAFNVPNVVKIYSTLGFTLALLLVILYRPNFINKNGSKISFGFLFNKNDFSSKIKNVDFNFHFFTNFYYKNKIANIEEFANLMEVSKEIMFNYIYFTYSMSFDELVNKSRVEYFVEIIKEAKFKNYTVEALAIEVGFSSRQRFYQPFKKYHGGNPSDLIDVF
jgi:AraC-like DNA-binding protein